LVDFDEIWHLALLTIQPLQASVHCTWLLLLCLAHGQRDISLLSGCHI